MAQLQVPDAPREYATRYHELLGVDYQADQTEVDRRRSPEMINMISDFGGNPVKRDGFRRVGLGYAALITVDSTTYGVYATDALLSVSKVALVGYEFVQTDTAPYYGNVGKIMAAFNYQQRIYIVAEHALVCFDTEKRTYTLQGTGTHMMSSGTVGESAPIYEDNIPDTVITLKPDGTGGTVLDDKNVASIYQRVNYLGDGTTTQYKIPNYKKIGNWVKAEVKDANGDWQIVTATLGTPTTETGKTLDGTGTMTSNVVDPTVTFATAPPAAGSDQSDNVRITFVPFSMDEAEANVKKGFYNETFKNLLASKAVTFQSSRMFLADKYRVYYSEVSDPFSISDLSWFDVDSEVVGFTRSNNYLAILAKDNGRSTIYLASEETRTVDSQSGTQESYFRVKESNAGIGAIAPKCIATLSDEPMFLSKTGLFGILTNWQSEKYAVNRSSRINRKLCKEPNLETAVGIAYNDYFYLAINGRMYVLDGRHKESDRAGNKPLEAYYFEGLPAIESMCVVNDKMYFISKADSGGYSYTYTWNDDLADTERYYDNAHMKTVSDIQYQISTSQAEEPTGEWVSEKPTPQEGEYLWYKVTFDDASTEITLEDFELGDKRITGDAVCARWCSAFDDDGSPQKLKTLMKKGTMITLVPHFRSGCEITLVKDGDVFQYLGSFDSSLQSFENISFLNFTFNANAVAVDLFTKKKIKKYKRLQIQVENNKAEPFGITQITKTYTMGNYAKR